MPSRTPDVRDCGVCGAPAEVRSTWERPDFAPDGNRIGHTVMVVVLCVAGHYYGGPLEDVLA